MAKLDFPDASYSPWVAPNNVIYTYIGTSPNGYWEANTANAATNLTAVFVERSGSTMTGALKLDNAASVSLPDISFDGDVNTGIYSPGADSLAITTAGTQRVTVDSSGNVGIGGTATGNFGAIDKGVLITGSDAQVGLRVHTSNGSSGILEIYAESGGSMLDTRGSGHIRVGSAGTEFMRIDSSGKVGVGASNNSSYDSIAQNLLVADESGNTGITIRSGGSTPFGAIHFADGTGSNAEKRAGRIIYQHAINTLSFSTADTEAMRIDSSGRVLINHTADTAPAGYASKLQLCDTSYQGSSLLLRRDQNNSSAPTLLFTKTRSSSKGGSTVVQNGDLTGQINFFAGDGTDSNCMTAYIESAVDGTPGSNDMPGRLSFHTTSDGSTASTERMRIDSSGRVGIGKTNLSETFEIFDDTHPYIYLQNSTTGTSSSDGFSIVEFGLDTYINNREAGNMLFFNNGSERMRIDSSGRLGLGTSSPTTKLHVAGDVKVVNTGIAYLQPNTVTAFQAYESSGPVKISLNNNGGATFAGGAFAIASDGDITTNVRGHGHIELDSSGSFSSPKIKLFSNTGNATFGGSAIFNSHIKTDAYLWANPTTNVAGFYNYQNLSTSAISYDQRNAAGSITITLNYSGSASFVGTVSAQGSVLTSDQRFKENITDANPQLADVTALGNKLRNWDWSVDAPIADKDTRFLGLVAQEVETVCPGIVTTIARTKDGAELTPETTDEEGNVTPATYEQLDDSYKGIKNDILIMKLLGAVAELSAKVAALEAG